jgi:hypothetical protein
MLVDNKVFASYSAKEEMNPSDQDNLTSLPEEQLPFYVKSVAVIAVSVFSILFFNIVL